MTNMIKKGNDFNSPARIYGNSASWLDKGAAVVGILTLGVSHWESNIPTWYSVYRATSENW